MRSASENRLPHLSGGRISVAYRMGKDLLGEPVRHFNQLGDSFALDLLGDHYVMTRDPAWMCAVLVEKNDAFKKDRVTQGISAVTGNGLLTNDSDSWRPRRKAMQPYFQPQALDHLIPTVQEETQKVVRRWGQTATIDLKETMFEVAMRAALRALFGVDPDEFSQIARCGAPVMDYFTGVFGTMNPLPLWIPTGINRRFLQARKVLRASLREIILRAQQKPLLSTPLTRLIEQRDEHNLSSAELLDEAMTLLLAGHDPSALTMAYTLACLSEAPSEQERIRDELRQTDGHLQIDSMRVDSAQKRALLESLRLFPASWAIGREAKEDVEIEGALVQKGTQLTLHQWAAHRHPKYFEEPDRFCPERWRNDFISRLPKGLFIPWGAGPRVCIGQHFSALQMMVSLGEILSHYRLTPVAGLPPKLKASITAQPREPLLVRVERCS